MFMFSKFYTFHASHATETPIKTNHSNDTAQHKWRLEACSTFSAQRTMTIIENVKFKNSDYVLEFVTFYRHYVGIVALLVCLDLWMSWMVFLLRLLFENRVHFNDTLLMVMESKYARLFNIVFYFVCQTGWFYRTS